MSEISCKVADEEGTHALAASLARTCRVGDCILLHGDLGGGKTAFSRGFIRAVQAGDDEVLSPTFSLVQTYPARGGHMIWHFDLYRLKSPAELVEIGLDEALNTGITLIEWPQMAEGFLPAQALAVHIAHVDGESGARQFTFSGEAHSWAERLQPLEGVA